MTDPIPGDEVVGRLEADCNDGRQLGSMVVTSRTDLRALLTLCREVTAANGRLSRLGRAMQTERDQAIEQLREVKAENERLERDYSELREAHDRKAIRAEAAEARVKAFETMLGGAEVHSSVSAGHPDPAKREASLLLVWTGEGAAARMGEFDWAIRQAALLLKGEG